MSGYYNKDDVQEVTDLIESGIDISNITEDTTVDELDEMINEDNLLDEEIIYYARAMEYLTDNDPSLTESIEIATDMGFTMEKLSSEILASLHKSQNNREVWQDNQEEILELIKDSILKKEEKPLS